MAKRFNLSFHFIIGLKLLAAIAGAELLIMLVAGWLAVERWLTPMQFDVVDASVLSITASFLIFYWVIKPLKAASRTIGEYKQLEEMLRSSERQYRNLFENNPQPMLIYDRETLSILAVNSAAVDHYGYSREEFLSMTVKDLHRPEDHPAVVASIAQIPGQIRRPGIWKQKKKEGTLIDVDIVTHDLVFNGRQARHVLITDVTERMRSEKTINLLYRQNELILKSAGEGIYGVDLNGNTTFINPSAAKMTGWETHEIIGKRQHEILHHSKPDGTPYPVKDCPIYAAFKDGAVHHVSDEVFWRKDGTSFPVEYTSTPIVEDGKLAGAVVVFRDVSEHKHSDEQIRQQLQQLSALREIDIAISSSLDIRLTLDIFLEQVLIQLHVDAACVLLMNVHSKTLEFAAQRGFRTQALKHTRIRLGGGNAGLAALKRSMVHIPDVKSDEAFGSVPLLPDEQFVSYYGVPLIAKGQVKGVLEIFHRSPFSPDQSWLEFLEALSLQAAIAIDNASLFMDLERSNLELAAAYDSTIEGWSRALDYRDRETEGHSQRVTDLTVEACRAMGIGEEALTHIRRGALLHDIGKMGVPDNILFKPGKLDDDEWKIMKRHPVIAYELLRPIRYLGASVDIPYCHHEKWDGTGYPRGLKGEQIPLAARIFSIIDVWDALGSDRPYRPAWPKEKIFQYLSDQSGKDFDPKVTEMFLKLLGEGAMSDMHLSGSRSP